MAQGYTCFRSKLQSAEDTITKVWDPNHDQVHMLFTHVEWLLLKQRADHEICKGKQKIIQSCIKLNYIIYAKPENQPQNTSLKAPLHLTSDQYSVHI